MKSFLKKIYHKNYRFKSFKVLGRTACLGNELIKRLGYENNCINHQKSRVDYLLELNEDKSIFSNHKEVIKYLENKYITGAIEHQSYDFFRYSRPNLIIMDSYSELTDQLFINKNVNKKFLANYSDLNQNKVLANYLCEGLLDESKIFIEYDKFFKKINDIYKGTPVYFIHFSTFLDNREKFKKRGNLILKVINDLSFKYDFINSLDIDNAFVKSATTNNNEYNSLPYHYSEETYEKYLELLKNNIQLDNAKI